MLHLSAHEQSVDQGHCGPTSIQVHIVAEADHALQWRLLLLDMSSLQHVVVCDIDECEQHLTVKHGCIKDKVCRTGMAH